MYSYTLYISSLEILAPEAAVAHAELTVDGHSCLVRPEVSKRSDSQEGAEGTLLLTLVT
jgi:hypothetical protein